MTADIPEKQAQVKIINSAASTGGRSKREPLAGGSGAVMKWALFASDGRVGRQKPKCH